MSKARDLADFQGSASALTTGTLPVDRVPYVGRRNILINGDFQVSQRGDFTTADVMATGKYQLDRWRGSLTSTASTAQDMGGSYKLTSTTNATGAIRMGQNIESINLDAYVGKTLTASAWLKSNNANARLLMYSNTSWLGWSDPVPADGQWHYVTLTVTLSSSNNTSVNFGLDGANSVDVSIASGDYIEAKEVQLELGSVATPFEHRSYGEELALCQRYFNNDVYVYEGRTTNGGERSGVTAYPVAMRAFPTVTTAQVLGEASALTGLRSNLSSLEWWYNASGTEYIRMRMQCDAEL